MIRRQETFDRREWLALSTSALADYIKSSKSRLRRPIGQWAEDEIILPTGPRRDLRFRCDTQPWVNLWFREWHNPYWHEYGGTGPSQSGKSLVFYVIPVLYCLFECRMDVVAGTTTREMAYDKWTRDILPVVEKSRYRDLIPKIGSASRGGWNELVTFLNGASLKWMTAGGGDKSRAYFTGQVLAITEANGFDPLATSEESHPIDQLEARLRSEQRSRRIVIKECTETTKNGYIHKLINKKGSAARIILPCPHCKAWVTPERKHLKGWQEATDELAVETGTHFHCPECDKPWTEKQRVVANRKAKLLHKGQRVSKNGRILGKLPPTRTLGFRYSAANNLLLPAGDIGKDEWEARESDDEINAEKKLCQFVWALPFEPPGLDLTKLDRGEVEQRKMHYPKGVVPASTRWISVAVDVGKYKCDWVAIAWLLPERLGLIFDYGEVKLERFVNNKRLTANELGYYEVFSEQMTAFLYGENDAIGIFDGFPVSGKEEFRKPNVVWIDSRWQGEDPDDKVLFNCMREWKDDRLLPVVGHGETQYKSGKYRKPRLSRKGPCVFRGHEYDIRFEEKHGLNVAHVDSDIWKAIVQQRLSKAPNEAGSLMLYESVNPKEHQQIVKEFDAEHRERVFKPGKGHVEAWIVERERNHKLDCAAYASAAGHFLGFRVNAKNDPKPRKPPVRRTGINLGKRPYMVTQR